MNKIIEKKIWSNDVPGIKEFVIKSPDIAKKHKAGQFVIIRSSEKGERIPLTVADKSPDEGLIHIVVQEVGTSTIDLGRMEVGESILDVVGPLGTPTDIKNFGTVVCVGGGIGVATMHTIVKEMKEAGNSVISIIGAKTKKLLIYEKRMKCSSDKLIITTDDGSYGKKGFVTNALEGLINEGLEINLVVTIGPPIMMKMVCELTKRSNIKTYASLNTIMMDGTGMCGACRVSVDGKTKFVCVDGPEFDGHKVDFDEMMKRLVYYAKEEQKSRELCIKRTCYGTKT